MHFNFLKRAGLVLLCAGLFITLFPASSWADEKEVLQYGRRYFQLALGVRHFANPDLSSGTLSADENYVYKLYGTEGGAGTVESPYYINRYSLDTFEAVDTVQIDGGDNISLGPMVNTAYGYGASLGRDLQGKYLYCIFKGDINKTVILDKENFGVGTQIIDFEFGQTNCVYGDKIYSFKSDGIHVFEDGEEKTEEGESVDIIIDKENTARMIDGKAVFLARRDGALKMGILSLESGGVYYWDLEEVEGLSVESAGTTNYLLGISPGGQIVAATRLSDCMMYIRSWEISEAEESALPLSQHISYQADTHYGATSSGAFPVFDHELHINNVFTMNRSSSTKAEIVVYAMDGSESPPSQTKSNVTWNRPLWGLETRDGYAHIMLATSNVIYQTTANHFNMKGNTANYNITNVDSSKKVYHKRSSRLQYGYRSDGIFINQLFVTSEEAADIYNAFAFKTEYETDEVTGPAIPLIVPAPASDGDEEGDDDSENGESPGQGNGTAEDPEENGGSNRPTRRFKLHRVY